MASLGDNLAHQLYGAKLREDGAQADLSAYIERNKDVILQYERLQAEKRDAAAATQFIRQLARQSLVDVPDGFLPPAFERIQRNTVEFYGQPRYNEYDSYDLSDEEKHKELFDAAFAHGLKWLFTLNMPKLEQFVRNNVEGQNDKEAAAKYLPRGLDEMIPAYVKVEPDIRFHEDKAVPVFEPASTFYFRTTSGGQVMRMQDALDLDPKTISGVALVGSDMDDAIPF